MNTKNLIFLSLFLIVSTMYSPIDSIYFLCILIGALIFFNKSCKSFFDIPSLFYLYFSIWILGSLIWTFSFSNSLKGTIFLFVSYVGVVFFYSIVKGDEFSLRRILYFLTVGSLIVNLRNIYYYFVNNDGSLRFSGIAEQPNSLGLLSSTLSIIILIYIKIYSKEFNYREKIIVYLSIFLCLIFLLLSGSRGSLLSVLIPCLYMYINYKKLFNIKYSLYLVFLSSIFYIFWEEIYKLTFFQRILLLPQALGVNIFSNLDVSEEFSAASDDSRLDIFNLVVSAFQQSPFFGHGVGSFKYFSDYVYAHNSFLEILFSMGVVGVFLYYFPLFFIFYKSYLFRKNKYTESIKALFLFLIISGISIPSFQSKAHFLALFLYLSLYGILCNFKRLEER